MGTSIGQMAAMAAARRKSRVITPDMRLETGIIIHPHIQNPPGGWTAGSLAEQLLKMPFDVPIKVSFPDDNNGPRNLEDPFLTFEDGILQFGPG